LVLLSWMIYNQVKAYDSTQLGSHFELSTRASWRNFLLVPVLMLMPLNWLLEAQKWRLLLSPFTKITFDQALKTIFVGITLGVVTPARVGEYAGRLISSDQHYRSQVITATMLGSIAQNTINIAVGLLLCYGFLNSIDLLNSWQYSTFTIVVSLQVALLLWIYYHLPKVVSSFKNMIKRIIKYEIKIDFSYLSIYSHSILNITIGISFLRYLTYFLQYFLILLFLGVGNDWIDLASSISTIFLIQTGIPVPAFLSIFARGELAILVWGQLSIPAFIALTASLILWFTNLIFPALIGLYFLYKEKNIHLLYKPKAKNQNLNNIITNKNND